jgi:hypothetical protein
MTTVTKLTNNAGATESILKKEDEDRIRDHLRRDGWSEFTVHEVFAIIDDEFEIDPESGSYLLEVHLEAARKASH